MRTLSARPWPMTLALTEAPLSASPSLTVSPSPSISTLSSLISLPASTSSSSTRSVSPFITRYCLPPVTTTAYMTRFLCSYFGRLPHPEGRTEAELYRYQQVRVNYSASRSRTGRRWPALGLASPPLMSPDRGGSGLSGPGKALNGTCAARDPGPADPRFHCASTEPVLP